MKQTVSTYEAAHMLLDDQYARWTRAQAFAIVEYLEQLEEDLDEEIEFDHVAIRCDYDAYDTIENYNAAYGTEYADVEGIENEGYFITDCADGSFIVQAH